MILTFFGCNDLVRKDVSTMIGTANIPQFRIGLKAPFTRYTKPAKPAVKQGMPRQLILISCLLIPFLSFSQFGLNVRHTFGQSRTLDSARISQDGLHASLEYHFRLKQNRVEFHPGLGYRFTWNSAANAGYLTSFDLDLSTSIYPFDFEGDCNCPTFSKQGTLIKKGFFFEIIPGLGYQILKRLKSDPDDPTKLPIRSKNLVFKLGGAAGLDIGISDHYTVTPMFSATLLSAEEWEGLHLDGSPGKLEEFVYLGAGIRVTYSEERKRRK